MATVNSVSNLSSVHLSFANMFFEQQETSQIQAAAVMNLSNRIDERNYDPSTVAASNPID